MPSVQDLQPGGVPELVDSDVQGVVRLGGSQHSASITRSLRMRSDTHTATQPGRGRY